MWHPNARMMLECGNWGNSEVFSSLCLKTEEVSSEVQRSPDLFPDNPVSTNGSLTVLSSHDSDV